MRKYWIGAVAAIAFAGGAFAQSPSLDRAIVAQQIIDYCVASPMGEGLSQPQVACACSAGLLSAMTNDRQFYAMGKVMPALSDESLFEQVAEELVAEGYTEDELNELAAIIERGMELNDSTCWPLRR